MTLGKLYVLVGIPASGKSSAIENLVKEHNAEVLSSDQLREELLGDINNQEQGGMIFDTLFKRANEYVQDGKNVIIDATNVNRRRRKHLIKQQVKASEHHAIYFCVPLEDAVERDVRRDRRVGREVIDRFYQSIDIPTIGEGWDSVTFVGGEDSKLAERKEEFEMLLESDLGHDQTTAHLVTLHNEFRNGFDLSQDSTYHSFSVSRHTYYVFKHVQDTYTGSRRKEMLVAALFHDVGKPHTKSFYNFKGELRRYASFIGHEKVSAQIVCDFLIKMGYDDDFVKYTVDLVQFHMKLMDIQRKGMNKLKSDVSEELLEDLKVFHEADLAAK